MSVASKVCLKRLCFVSPLLILLFPCWNAAHARQEHPVPLTMNDRIDFQRAIEQVSWNHRIWPNDSKTTKTSLVNFLPEASLRARVEGYLKKSDALDPVKNAMADANEEASCRFKGTNSSRG